jgi:hypothetical protein
LVFASPTERRGQQRDSFSIADSLRIVKQGTGRTVLVTDLFASEGPFQDAARDFVAGTCSICMIATGEQDARFHNAGYLCPNCWQFAGGSGG